MATHIAIIIGLAIYCCVMIGVSFFWMIRVNKASDYLVAGRGLPYWALTGSITATCVGTGVVIGASGLAYHHGWAGCAYPIGLGLGTLLAGLFFAKMRRYNFMTLGEEIACYFAKNRGVVTFSYISLFFSQLCWLTVQIMGGGAILNVVTGLNPELCVVLAGLITAVISIPGGLKTVVYTDLLQALILLGGFGFLTYASLTDVGGLMGLKQMVPDDYFSFLGIHSYGRWKIFSLILVLALSVIADPGRRLAMYSARSEAGARSSMVIGGIIVMIFSIVVGIMGMYAFALNPHLSSGDKAIPWLILNVLPTGLAAVVVVSIASSIFSSANTNAAAASTFYIRHIYPMVMGNYPDRPMVAVRRALACAFVLCTVLALYTENIVSFVVKFLPLTMSGLAVIILFGRFWKRATWQGAIAALVTTPAVALTVIFVPSLTGFWGNPTITATLAGSVVHFVVSLLTPPPKHNFEEIAESMIQEREHIEGKHRGKIDHPELSPMSNTIVKIDP